MAITWFSLTVDAADPARLAAFWSEALGYRVVFSEPDQVAVARDEQTFPGMVFVRAGGEKQGKNRLHLDLNPDDQAAEVERLVALGATRVDIGQGDVRWVVLADPEGNEFCVLTPWRLPG